MSDSLEVNVFTFICMLFLFLGLQLQIRQVSKKLDELMKR